jgi:SAM-dependent methyltransferase
MPDPTKRFSSRVGNYIKYRPGYPVQIVDFLKHECALTAATLITDVGSGTGKLAELFLANGNQVLGVEPNQAMREAGERLLAPFPKFKSLAATAEATTLPDHSVDMVTAGQAFHWFDKTAARHEFQRILKPGGFVVLIWNDRKTEGSPFLQAYEELLMTFGTDYQDVNHRHVDAKILDSFFGSGGFKQHSISNEQHFDFEGLKGRLLSSSYAPEAGHPRHQPMLERLQTVFQAHQQNGKVAMEYDTLIFYGKLV